MAYIQSNLTKIMKRLYKKLIPESSRISIRIFIRKINSCRYLGNKVTCNCCNKNFRKFLPFGDSKQTKRDNALCPWCQALERTRLLWDYLNTQELLIKNVKILHFGPARIIEKNLKKIKTIDYLSADINPNLAMEVMDITNITYEHESFDFLICSHILSDIPDDILALNEMYKVLKKGGTLILIEPTLETYNTHEDKSLKTEKERLNIYGNRFSLRFYGRDLISKISSIGFKVIEYDYKKTLSEKKIKKYGLQNSGEFFLCKK